jgi:hypothetical protein
VASALYYLCIPKLAEAVYNFGLVNEISCSFINEFNNFLCKQQEFKDRWILKSLPQNYDLIKNIDVKGPKVVRLMDSWGSIDHVITLVDGMIFDSNQSVAMSLSHYNLDACCVGNNHATFTMVHSGYHYLPKRRKQNKFTKKRRRMELPKV